MGLGEGVSPGLGSSAASMKRTIVVCLVGVASLLAQSPVAVGGAAVPNAPKPDPIEGIVTAMRTAEAELTSLRLVMTTRGELPSELVVTTRGTLHVLRGTQRSSHMVLEYAFGDGVRGRAESSHTAEGIVLYEDDPGLGEVHLAIDKGIVADLEWAGSVLQREDLPGMADRRSEAPLGSGMLAELRRHFDLTLDARTERSGEAGTWIVGARKPGLDVQDPDLPVSDHVEVFVRAKDHALLELRELQDKKVVQQLVVESLELGIELPAKTFVVDGHGQRQRDVRQHLPLWEQIEQVVKQAEAKSGDDVVRPSRRK